MLPSRECLVICLRPPHYGYRLCSDNGMNWNSAVITLGVKPVLFDVIVKEGYGLRAVGIH